MYATKRRRRSIKSVKPPMKDPPKSNPSKRHRERLNSELDHLASLLPFEQSVISKLDKLSILRLAVSYLRTKSYFQAVLHERYSLEPRHHHHHHRLAAHNHLYGEPCFTDTDTVLQALNGFLFAVTSDGEVFFASRTVEQYLGFHQSDIIHQSALELIHSEDREDFKTQLNWRSQLPQDQANINFQEAILPENCHWLHRSFTVRFRCLLDNTSGFITLEITGYIRVLHGQNLKGSTPTQDPPLALFAMCCPFGPLPLLDIPPRDYTFKSKHKMDMAPVSMDHRGKLLFGYTDHDLCDRGGYDLIHPDDLTYFAAAHQELIKTGSSGMIAYRWMTKDQRWLWLQTSSRVIYKNSKPDYVICTHRHLTDDEGRDLLGKRGTEFKLPYPLVDCDLSGLSSPFEDDSKTKSPKSKKSKSQMRDYLQAGRKRKTPYRDVFNGLNGYNSPYIGLNGYSSCQPDVKGELVFPYCGNGFGLDSDLYRSTAYSTFPSSVYPHTDTFRLDTTKHSYTNGYYLDTRQYQNTLQYPGNGYSDLVASSAKYGYDIPKYGYDVAGYGLDLAKRGYYDDDITRRYEQDLHKYSTDLCSTEKFSKLNGAFDGMKGTTNMSGYGTGVAATDTSAYFSNSTSVNSNSTSYSVYSNPQLPMKNGKLSNSIISEVSPEQQVQNGHTSVIRNISSPRNKVTLNNNSGYSQDANSVISWPSCEKASVKQNKTSPILPAEGSTPNSCIESMTNAVPSRIVSPVQSNTQSVGSVITSVIQHPQKARGIEKQPSPASIAVPVVKSSNWASNASYSAGSCDWGSSDPYYSQQRVRSALTASGDYSGRSVIEHAKLAQMKIGSEAPDANSQANPLLSFSEVTHTLLSGD